jgi:hypothetical protein
MDYDKDEVEQMMKDMATKGDIRWLHGKLKYEDFAENRNMDINHWYEMMEGMTFKQFKRFEALFYSADMEGIEDFLDQFGIKHL